MSSKRNLKNDRKWFRPMFELDENSPKKICLENDKKSATSTVSNHSFSNRSNLIDEKYKDDLLSENWIDKFCPKTISDLAVNNKKIQEVQDWISKSLNCQNSNDILLLIGPPGCGKTATVSLIAKHLNTNISEWITPIDIEYIREFDTNSYTYQEKQNDKFLEFLLKASRYPSLLSDSNNSKIILVEDIPNIFLKDQSLFVDVLQKYQDSGKSPLIFICTEGSSNGFANISWNLFPPNVQEKFKITNISFNPVSTTNMKNAFKRILAMMGNKFKSFYEIPSQECIDGIINSSMGDIRSAVNNLHFTSLKSTYSTKIKKIVQIKSSKRGKKKNTETKLSSMGKDENISIMHGVGRVLNPKLIEKSDIHPIEEYTHSPKIIAEQFQMQPNSFVKYLHENYLPHFSNINHVEKAANMLSDADCLISEWKEKDSKQFGLLIAIAGLMTANKTPVSSWHPIKAAKNMKVEYPRTRDVPMVDCNQLVQGKVLAVDFKPFCDIIDKLKLDFSNDDDIEDMFEEDY